MHSKIINEICPSLNKVEVTYLHNKRRSLYCGIVQSANVCVETEVN
jgi:hypothetical protein